MMIKSETPTSDTPAIASTLSTNFSLFLHLLLLFSLLAAPALYNAFWEQGMLRLFFLITILLFVLIGITAFYMPRRFVWYPPRLWFFWLISGFLVITSTWAADTSFARALQVTTTFYLLALIFQAKKRDATSGVPVVISLLLGVFLVSAALGINRIRHPGIGFCHILSEWRAKGCRYSYQLPYQASSFLTTDPQTGIDKFLVLDSDQLWIYPHDTVLATWQTHAINLSTGGFPASGVVNEYQNQFRVVWYQWYIGIPYLLKTGEALIDLNKELVLDQNQLEIKTAEEEQAYINQLTAFQSRAVSPDEPIASFVSSNGRLSAISFRDGRVSLWHQNPTPQSKLPTFNPLPTVITPPDEVPFWTIEASVVYDCLAFSPDNKLLVAHAGTGTDLLRVYDIEQQQELLSLPFEANGPCPIFSHNSQWLVLADNIDLNQFWLLDARSGDVITSFTFDRFNMEGYGFSNDDHWLMIEVSEITQHNKSALFFRIDELLTSGSLR